MSKLGCWLCFYKPINISSAKFLKLISVCFPGVKIGHAGTLDPLAEGVLPVALGEATKLAEFLIDSKKTYEFDVQFGAKTSSGDLGSDITEVTHKKVSKTALIEVLKKFTGNISQTPSKFSAIKINGVRAYAMARKGMDFEMPSRIVSIYSLELKSFDHATQQATIVCECSKGTYIRTLAEDIGFSLHNLSHVIKLRRLKVGKFDATNSIMLDFEQKDFDSKLKLLKDSALPVDFVLDDILVINVEEDIAQKIRYGQQVTFSAVTEGVYAVFSSNVLQAIGSVHDEVFKVRRVFNL